MKCSETEPSQATGSGGCVVRKKRRPQVGEHRITKQAK